MLAKHWQHWQSVGKFADVLPTLPTDGQHWPDLACLLGHVIMIHETTNRVKRQFLGRKIFNSLVIRNPTGPGTAVQIFVSIGGDNLQFYPNFALFLRLGGDEP